ncbi:MAG: glycosyltransferase family 9 protein [Planctomycetes bacterium]|nr:glycosyltransferase family 9 protein [Planctomycetota bacterium]
MTTRLALGWAKRQARRFPPQPMEPLPPDTTARILVVNTTGIGDTIFCTAPIADLRKSFPNAVIDAFIDRRRIGLLSGNPHLNDVVVYPGKFKSMRATIRTLREKAYDVAIIQHANDPDVVPMVASARPKHMVGYENHTFSQLYGIARERFDKATGHTIDSRLGLCKAIGANGEHWHMELYPSEMDTQGAKDLLAEFGLTGVAPIALNIGGSAPRKRWPATHWDALARLLSERGLPAIFLGGPEDSLAGEMIREHIGDADNMHFAVGRLDLGGVVALLSLCRAHVSGDTGLLHAGYARDVPSVALFGPDDPSWTGPYPKQAKSVVIRPPRSEWPDGYDTGKDKTGELMKLIGAQDVMTALDTLGAIQ